jgi:NADH dehydrogenase FAD-containing subunit
MSTAHVVIIGGGFAGTYCAQLLENDMKVTLIDTKEHFEFTPSFLRLIVQPSKLRTIQVGHCHGLRFHSVIFIYNNEFSVFLLRNSFTIFC